MEFRLNEILEYKNVVIVSCLEIICGTNSSEEDGKYMTRLLLDVSVFTSTLKKKILVALLNQNINDNIYFIILLRCTPHWLFSLKNKHITIYKQLYFFVIQVIKHILGVEFLNCLRQHFVKHLKQWTKQTYWKSLKTRILC